MIQFLILALATAISTHALPPDAKSLDAEREMLRALFQLMQKPVDGRACDLKPAAGTLKVSDLVFSYVLWSAQKEREGVERVPGLGCREGSENTAGERECWLTAAEKIRRPGEPEGWSRTLLFRYHPQKKKIVPGSLRCVDVP